MCPGKSTSTYYIDEHQNGAVQKVVLVREGGMLELHGERKTSWTRLAQTIPVLSDLPCPFIYDHSDYQVLYTSVSSLSSVVLQTGRNTYMIMKLSNNIPVRNTFCIYAPACVALYCFG